jgi:hypothetical protein
VEFPYAGPTQVMTKGAPYALTSVDLKEVPRA